MTSTRWFPVAAYALVSSANQLLWLTFAPITTAAARHYGVSEDAVGWLAEVFPLLYVVLALPTGRLVDRWFRPTLLVGAGLTAFGALLRLGGGFGAVLVGQLVVAVAQPLVLNAVTTLAVGYVRPRDRPTAIAVSSAGIFAGLVIALGLGAALGGHRIPLLLGVEAAYAVLAAVVLAVALRPAPADGGRPAQPVAIRTVWADRYLRRLCGLAVAGFGVFVALTTWLQPLLKPAGVSESAAGVLLVVLVVAGVVGSALAPPVLFRHGIELTAIGVGVLGVAVGCAVLAVVPGIGSGAVVAALVGLLLLTDLPVILELAERRAGPATGTVTALIWLSGNAGGLVVALAVQALLHRPAVAFGLLGAVSLAALPLLAPLRDDHADRPPIAGLSA